MDNTKVAEDFVRSYDGDFEFLTSMRKRVTDGDPLSDGMVSAILRCKRRADERALMDEPDATGVNLSAIPFKRTFHAVPNADGDPVIVRIDRPQAGKWQGWSFAHFPAGRRGKQKDGGTYVGDGKALALKITNNWRETMRLYGKHEHKCGACGRRLNPNDYAVGFGKSCARKVANVSA